MEKKDLIKMLDELFIPLGYKRKGNNWVKNGTEINKILNLQKSQYSNSFYINYYYVINNLPLNGFLSHVDNQLGSADKDEQMRITNLLNLESLIDSDKRISELKKRIKDVIISEMESIESENDLYEVLKKRRYLYTIPPFVLKHFGIESQRNS